VRVRRKKINRRILSTLLQYRIGFTEEQLRQLEDFLANSILARAAHPRALWCNCPIDIGRCASQFARLAFLSWRWHHWSTSTPPKSSPFLRSMGKSPRNARRPWPSPCALKSNITSSQTAPWPSRIPGLRSSWANTGGKYLPSKHGWSERKSSIALYCLAKSIHGLW